MAKKTEHLALAFSPEYHKSRLRLIYFSAIGGLLSFFEIKPDSSLFGMSFQGLTAEKVAFVFFLVNTVFLIDHLIRLFEEGPIIQNKYRSAYHRYSLAAESLEALVQNIDARINSWKSETSNLKNALEIFEANKNAAETAEQLDSSLSKLVQRCERASSQLRARTGEMLMVVPSFNDIQKPPYIPGKMGWVRLWIELLSGVVAYLGFLAFTHRVSIGQMLDIT